jgi:hemolysin III
MGERMHRRLREPVNGLTHLAAAIAAAVGLVILIYLARHSTIKLVALSVYGLSLVLMFSASTAYHLVKASPKMMLFLRKLDHSAIYLLIAGTYTPICLNYFTGTWRWAPLVVIWSLAIIGIIVKLFVIGAPHWVTAGVYLLMGWLAIVAVREVLVSIPIGALVWLLLGGLFFTGGAVAYILKKPDPVPGVFGFHEIWHIFVILGTFSHFIVMAAYVAPSGSA